MRFCKEEKSIKEMLEKFGYKNAGNFIKYRYLEKTRAIIYNINKKREGDIKYVR